MSKDVILNSTHLNLPLGLHLSWERGIPFRLLSKIIDTADDLEFCGKDQVTLSSMLGYEVDLQ